MRMRRIFISIFLVTLILIGGQMPSYAEINRGYGQVFCRGAQCSRKIALTFDDGPHPRYTERILAILKEYGITATFFVIGINAERYPKALKMIYDSGCEIGNHTYYHKRIKDMCKEDVENEIVSCEQTLFKSLGIRPTVFRPPEGLMPSHLADILSKRGYNAVLWSIDTLDWTLRPSNEISDTVLNEVKGGDIILMHDYVSGAGTSCDALRLFIPRLLEKGYEFVTVSELIKGDCSEKSNPLKLYYDSAGTSCSSSDAESESSSSEELFS